MLYQLGDLGKMGRAVGEFEPDKFPIEWEKDNLGSKFAIFLARGNPSSW